MNVAHKLDYPLEYYPEETQRIINVIGGGIVERLLILHDEIEDEETQKPNGTPCGILIVFSGINSTFYLQYIGYSDALKEKIKGSLDDDYLGFILAGLKEV